VVQLVVAWRECPWPLLRRLRRANVKPYTASSRERVARWPSRPSDHIPPPIGGNLRWISPGDGSVSFEREHGRVSLPPALKGAAGDAPPCAHMAGESTTNWFRPRYPYSGRAAPALQPSTESLVGGRLAPEAPCSERAPTGKLPDQHPRGIIKHVGGKPGRRQQIPFGRQSFGQLGNRVATPYGHRHGLDYVSPVGTAGARLILAILALQTGWLPFVP